MLKCCVLLFAVLCGASSQAQTKWIAHRSHSGSDASFTITGTDNFGLPSAETIKAMAKRRQEDSLRLRMDSMIKIGADTVTRITVLPPPKKKMTKAKKGLKKSSV